MGRELAINGGFIDRWRRPLVVVAALGLAFFTTGQAHAMHIAEGLLPQWWSVAWYVATAPFFLWGMRRIGAQVADQLEDDRIAEVTAVKLYNDAIRIAVEVGDNGTRDLFEATLKDEENHIDWLEAQLDQIKQMGLPNYLAQQVG